MKTITAIFLAMMLAACQTTGSKQNQISGDTVKPTPRAQPVEAMVPCKKPAPLEDKSFGAVVRKLSETLGLLDECASKQEQEAEWIKADPQYKQEKPAKK